jgi:hypothetical protein
MAKPDPLLDDLKRIKAELDRATAVKISQVREAIDKLLQHAIEEREKGGGAKTVVGVKG